MKTFPDSIPAPPHRRRPVWGICFCGDETSPSSSLRSMPPPLVGEALAFCDVFQQTQISFIENETSPSSSLRSMPPPLVGEALAFRDVFQQTQISFIENETSLPRAPLPGKTPPAGEVARKCRKGNGCRADARLRGWTKDAFRVSGERRCCSVQPLRHLRFARCHLPCQERLPRPGRWHESAERGTAVERMRD